jgi:hypothetical protein
VFLQRTVARTLLAYLGFDVETLASPADLFAPRLPASALGAADAILIAVGGGDDDADPGRAAIAELRQRAVGEGGSWRPVVVEVVARVTDTDATSSCRQERCDIRELSCWQVELTASAADTRPAVAGCGVLTSLLGR